jgi:hypothetical protein
MRAGLGELLGLRRLGCRVALSGEEIIVSARFTDATVPIACGSGSHAVRGVAVERATQLVNAPSLTGMRHLTNTISLGAFRDGRH